ncbi:DRTGG domain-containing protein [Bacteroidales bacterium]|nr:DRTGG domain-containing protein [Bacteroidales bacterium]
MKVSTLVKKLDLKVISGHEGLEREITGGYVSDLLSDVMGKGDEGDIWVTLMAHINVMAVASLKEMSAVVLINGITPDQKVIDKSNEEQIPILSTNLPTYEITGQIYNVLKG